MDLVLPALGVTLAAFCVWLTVRLINRRKKFRWALWTTVGLAAMVTVYSGAYLAMVRPVGQEMFGGIRYVPSVYWGPLGKELSPEKRRCCLWLFGPALEIDRRIRPERWPPWKDLMPGTRGPRL